MLHAHIKKPLFKIINFKTILSGGILSDKDFETLHSNIILISEKYFNVRWSFVYITVYVIRLSEI